ACRADATSIGVDRLPGDETGRCRVARWMNPCRSGPARLLAGATASPTVPTFPLPGRAPRRSPHALPPRPSPPLQPPRRQLPPTQAAILDAISDLDLDVRTGESLSSVVAVLDGARPGPTVLLRGDMDALPLTEDTGLEFASVADGVMHACGHDTHVAMLAG